MAGPGSIGDGMRRREDPALLRGEATFTDDVEPPDVLHAAILRSRFAHARIQHVDATAAEAHDETVAVYTADDVRSTDVPGAVTIDGPLPKQTSTDFPLIAGDVVKYGGESVAVVLAESPAAARTATGLIDVDYDRLDAVVDADDALSEAAPTIHDHHEDNRAFDWAFGDREAVDDALERSEHVVDLDLRNQRVHPDAMEPRSALAEYDPTDDVFEVVLSTQSVFKAREWFSDILGIDEDRLRVTAPAVGGGFGSKTLPYSEEPLVLWSAAQVDRPVKWTATRSESHQSDHHGRDVRAHGTLALDADGSIQALEVEATFNLGAYLVWSKTPATHFRTVLSGQYDVPAIAGTLTGAYTNTTPVAPYRGAGRPEGIYVIERLLSRAADEMRADPAELRRRNLIDPDRFPFETATGAVYDSGDYEQALDRALERSGYREYREIQREGRTEGRHLGIGVACVIENVGVQPGWSETARVVVEPSGSVTAYCGTVDQGQGHDTTFSQLLSETLGVPFDAVRLVEGDTDDLPDGTGTFGSRSAAVGGSAILDAAEEVVRQAKSVAARHLEVAIDDVEIRDGRFHPAGAPRRSLDWQTVAVLAMEDGEITGDGAIEATATYDPANFTYPFGTHVAVVEVAPSTGEIEILEYVAVDDCGVQFNPMVVEGQVHGGVVQGIGQAVYEQAAYDENGTLLTTSLQDYALPRATAVPSITTDHTVTPCPHNPSGAKGVGECGTTSAPAVVVNAVVDALRPFGVENLDMPVSPETIWRAIDRSGRDEVDP